MADGFSTRMSDSERGMSVRDRVRWGEKESVYHRKTGCDRMWGKMGGKSAAEQSICLWMAPKRKEGNFDGREELICIINK